MITIKKIRTNTGFKGVSKRTSGSSVGKYQAEFYKNGNKANIGTFNKLKDAINARVNYIEKLIQ